MNGAILEATLRSLMDGLSNGQTADVKDEWIEEAGEQFKNALRKQLKPDDREFKLRMSNIGRPLCQLQMEQKGVEPTRKPYNHIVRMLIGDSVEVMLRLFLRIADVSVTSDGDKVSLNILGTEIKGESDIDIDGRVYDIKSASTWAFKNKWSKGFHGLMEEDDFGYVGQLFGYADAQKKPAGGWIVADKSSGEIAVVDADPDVVQLANIRKSRNDTTAVITDNAPFRRCFEAYEETFYGKKTGAKRLPRICEMCSYLKPCWPEAELRPAPKSKAKVPPRHWYTEYPDEVRA